MLLVGTTSISSFYKLCRARVFVGAMGGRKTFKGIQPGFTVSHIYYDRFQGRKTSKFRNSLVHRRKDASFSRKYWMAHHLSFRYLHDREDICSKRGETLK